MNEKQTAAARRRAETAGWLQAVFVLAAGATALAYLVVVARNIARTMHFNAGYPGLYRGDILPWAVIIVAAVALLAAACRLPFARPSRRWLFVSLWALIFLLPPTAGATDIFRLQKAACGWLLALLAVNAALLWLAPKR